MYEGKVIKISPNFERSKSLLSSAKNTIKFVESHKIDNENAPILLTNFYEAVLEICHALLFQKGFKVLDHLSVGYYIKDILKHEEYFNIFNKSRKLRNNIVYYGKKIGKETAEEYIDDLKKLINFIKNLIEN